MRSMNALTNAVNYLAALIAKDIVRPADGKDAFKMLEVYHEQMMHLHERKTESKP